MSDQIAVRRLHRTEMPETLTHGTHKAYMLDHCRCDACSAARSAYLADWRVRCKTEGPQSVRAYETQRHVLYLASQGMSASAIAAAAEVDVATITKLPQRKSVHRSTAEKILGVTACDAGPGHLVPPQYGEKLLEALAKAGFNPAQIARLFGLHRGAVRPGPQGMQWRAYRRLRTLYELACRAGRVPAALLDEVPA
jgi:hypothetical protein